MRDTKSQRARLRTRRMVKGSTAARATWTLSHAAIQETRSTFWPLPPSRSHGDMGKRCYRGHARRCVLALAMFLENNLLLLVM